MIYITGDTAKELADLQTLLETGMVNGNKDTTLHVTYKLSSGNILLVDSHDHIVGEEEQEVCIQE